MAARTPPPMVQGAPSYPPQAYGLDAFAQPAAKRARVKQRGQLGGTLFLLGFLVLMFTSRGYFFHLYSL